jgi:superfamily I DNA/RNA helicase
LASEAKKDVDKYGAKRVVIASLTKAAAHEFSSRGLNEIPREQRGTLHSICFHALGSPQIAAGKKSSVEDWNTWLRRGNGPEGYAMAWNGRQLAGPEGFDMSEDEDDPDTGSQLLNILSQIRSQFLPDEINWTSQEHIESLGIGKEIAGFRNVWTAWKEEAQVYDFTDLLEQCLLNMEHAPGNPKVLYGDEAQDWSRLEAVLFRDHWGRHAEKVMLVGDPDQAIYAWRGADPRIFLDHPVPENQKILLEQSYRVPRAVHQRAQAWIRGQVIDREDVEYRPRDFEGSCAIVQHSFAAARHINGVFTHPLARFIERWLARYPDETLMVLASCNYMLAPLIAALREEGVPFHNPYRPNPLWNPLRRGRTYISKGKTETTALDRMLAFLRGSVELYGKHATEWSWHDLNLWLSTLPGRGPSSVLAHGSKTVVRTRAVASGGRQPGQYSMAAFGELFVGGWEGPFANPAHEAKLDWWVSMIPKKMRGPYRMMQRIVERRGPRALLETPRLIIGTIHSVKGGESDTVLICPDLSRAASLSMQNSLLQRDATGRLFYVAMTRARKRLLFAAQSSPYGFNLHGGGYPREDCLDT